MYSVKFRNVNDECGCRSSGQVNIPEAKVYTGVALGERVPFLDLNVPEVAAPELCEVPIVHGGEVRGEGVVDVLLAREEGVRNEDDASLVFAVEGVLDIDVWHRLADNRDDLLQHCLETDL
jgi:hypothetical protein